MGGRVPGRNDARDQRGLRAVPGGHGRAAATLLATNAPLRGQVRVASPDGRNQITVELREGRLTWSLARDGRASSDVLALLRDAEYETFGFNDGVLALPTESRNQIHEVESFGAVPLNVELETPVAVSR